MKSRATDHLTRAEKFLDQGEAGRALAEYNLELRLGPSFSALHGRASALLLLARYAEALVDFDAALRLRPNDIATITNRGSVLQRLGRHNEALDSFDRALTLRPAMTEILYSRANLLQEMGRFKDALLDYNSVLARVPNDAKVLNNRGNTLHKMACYREALIDFEAALALWPDYAAAFYNRGRTLCESGKVAEGFESFMRAAEAFPLNGDPAPGQAHKRRHDGEQQIWMRAAGLDPSPNLGPIHIEGGARVTGHAINPASAGEVARAWRENRPQLVVVDELLTREAMAGLQQFCRGSTIWRKSYERGYLGAFPESGFACPLLAQIADEFRSVFPAVFGEHPLVYLWGFKYDSRLQGIEVHADEAAVNVNFWITPEDANLDPNTGGLVVWDQAAPLDWGFGKFNADIPAAREFLHRSGARATRIPYRANRAVIFDSDLFHETDTIRFREGYENRRINCTLLYGFRDTRRR